MADDVDQSSKLDLLAAFLDPATFSFEELSDALKTSKGDIQKAAEELLIPRIKSSGKRKAGSSLESWLGKRNKDIPRDEKILENIGRNHRKETYSDEKDNEDLKPRKITTPTKALNRSINEGTKAIENGKDAFTILKDVQSQSTFNAKNKPKNPPQPALHLTSQEAIDKHKLPLTFLQSPLSPAFASALYLAMMDESESWGRHQWYLAGKWVESPHTNANYYQEGGGYGPRQAQEMEEKSEVNGSAEGEEKEWKRPSYYYSGTELYSSKPYPELLRQAAELIEPVVNASLAKRARYPLEWAGKWRANCCGANRYDGGGSGVGWHADQLTYLGPYTTIASLSLGTPRNFRLRQTDTIDPSFKDNPNSRIRTYEVNLGHNSLVLMNAGCQERYKHTAPTQKAIDLFRPGWYMNLDPVAHDDQRTYTSRINITFRFFREDFYPNPSIGPYGPREGTPYCRCGIPTLLRADQKAKARSNLPSLRSPRKPLPSHKPHIPDLQLDDSGVKGNVGIDESNEMKERKVEIVDDDMVFFWQCQSPGNTGDLKGCGFFRILDMKAEGRGPCIVDGAIDE